MHLGEIGFYSQGPAMTGDGFFGFPETLKRQAKIAVRLDVVGPEGKCFGNEINGVAVVSHLVGNETKQVQDDGPIGIGLQYFLTYAPRLGQTARRMMLHRQIDGLAQCEPALFPSGFPHRTGHQRRLMG
jgi:hypothetical protein